MTERARGRLAWSIAIASTVVNTVAATYSVVFQSQSDYAIWLTAVLGTAAFAVVGAIIAWRTGNAVGWALLAVIGALAVSLATETYATYSLTQATRELPLTLFSAWIGTFTFFLGLALIVAVPLLYPNGTALWRWVWRIYLAGVILLVGGFAVQQQELSLLTEDIPGPRNPYAIEAVQGWIGTATAIGAFAVLGCAVASIVALFVRYRRSRGDEHQQIKWLAYVGIAAVIGFAAIIVTDIVYGDPPPPGLASVISNGVFLMFVWIVIFGIPAACGVAILKYRLYDLDIVVRKTVLFTTVAITLTVLYLGVLALATVGNAPRIVVGLVLLVVTFRPVLRAARAFADRVTYGKRASAYEVLSEFSGRVGETYATEDVLPRMAQILAEATGAATARVLLRVGTAEREAARWPADATTSGEEHRTPVVHQGEELGALAVTMPPEDPLDASRERLVNDLAAQAGLVLRNARLIEDLRASRQRLVAAQDEERRRLERNIHDGAQQQLVALAVQLKVAQQLAGTNPDKERELLGTLIDRTGETLEDLRDLARGIYPPLLADQGLPAALEAQARKAAVPTTVAADGIGRFPQEVEAAVYFSCLEALQNTAKYAAASSAHIALTNGAGELSFTVSDDGAGFDAAATSYGTGLQGIADRLAAIGGELTVSSEPGIGTTITGTVSV